MKVVMHNIPDSKIVSCGLWIGQGSAYETKENNGISHLIEHLLINPNNNKEYKKMEKALQAGAIYNATTTKEYTCFYFTGLLDA